MSNWDRHSVEHALRERNWYRTEREIEHGTQFIVTDRTKIVVVSGPDTTKRHWIITAYLTRKLVEGEVEWRRS